ncbi:MAG TPA: EAL domain-containing response regulator [Nevskiaceae bacterium]|nr:EAL domain-containing response regulator [Nevskiaceae bacterium]
MPQTIRRVLVVEGELPLAEDTRLQLVAAGVQEVTLADSRAAALARLAEARIDLLICDIGLSEQEGIALLRALSTLPGAPAVLLTARADASVLQAAELLAESLGLAVIGALPKPVSETALQEMLQRERRRRLLASQVLSIEPPADAVLLEAFTQGHYQAYFEARISRRTGRVEGVEVLARLLPPGLAPLGAQAFIGRLEALGRIDALTWQMAEQGYAFVRQAGGRGRALAVSLNLSPVMLSEETLVSRLVEGVARAGLHPRDVTLEITESAAIDSSPAVLAHLVQLRLSGFGLSIDDFGTGFSSLAQLSRVPVTEIKIDRQFTHRALIDPKARVVVESTIDLARRLGIRTCAEGVDSAEVLSLLEDLGADAFQGYHFHQPMPARDFLEWMLGTPGR